MNQKKHVKVVQLIIILMKLKHNVKNLKINV